jgi:hypothetical protein
MTTAQGMVKPPVFPPLCRTVPGGHLPTLMQYCLDPRDTDRVLASQTLDDLCGEFRVTCPDFTDANAGDGPAIDGPPHLRLRPALLDRGFPTALDDSPRSHHTYRLFRAHSRDEFLGGEMRMLLP